MLCYACFTESKHMFSKMPKWNTLWNEMIHIGIFGMVRLLSEKPACQTTGHFIIQYYISLVFPAYNIESVLSSISKSIILCKKLIFIVKFGETVLVFFEAFIKRFLIYRHCSIARQIKALRTPFNQSCGRCEYGSFSCIEHGIPFISCTKYDLTILCRKGSILTLVIHDLYGILEPFKYFQTGHVPNSALCNFSSQPLYHYTHDCSLSRSFFFILSSSLF